MLINNNSIKFIKSNKLIIIIYLLIIGLTIPIETIGYSHFISDITTSVKGKNFNYKIIYKSIILIIVIYLVTRIFYSLKYYIGILIGNRLNYHVRTNIFSDIMNKCKKNFDQIEKGKIISFLTSIPGLYEEKLDFLLTKILPDGVGVLGLTLFFYYIDIKLGIILTVMIIFIGISISSLSKKCVLYKLDKQETFYSNNESFQDKLSNIFSILTSNRIDTEISKNNLTERVYQKKKLKADLQDLKAENILIVVIVVFTISILLYFIRLFKNKKNKKLVITGFLVFFTYLGYIDSLKWYVIDYINKISLIKQYEKDIMVQNNIHNGDKKDFINNGNIKLVNIYFYYDFKTIILKNINCEFKFGKLNVIMGSSGTGKSTIFKLILKLIQPKKGNIFIDNINLYDSDTEYLRQHIGIVNQNTTLFNDSLYKNISYNNNVSKTNINNIIKEWNLELTIFKNINLETIVGVDGYYLSNGQRQMVLILREYLNNKKIILMDEPTSSLDIDNKKLILNIISKMKVNKNIIVTSHDSIIKEYADFIYYINKQQKN